MMFRFLKYFALSSIAFSAVMVRSAEPASTNALPVTALSRTDSIDFEKEILPFLKESCLACHNQTKAKADLILETPQTILKGGESGPGVVPGRAADSLIFKASAHVEKPFMPPKDNKANAPDLNPDQLALLKLWIDQGARGEVRGLQPIAWQSVSTNVRPILSLALTADGQLAACGKANELYLYQLPTGQTIGPLNDAHRDLVESLDFSPDGELLASGSYREVKLWRRQHNLRVASPILSALKDANIIATSAASNWCAFASDKGRVEIWKNDAVQPAKVIELGSDPIRLLRISADGARLAVIAKTNALTIWNCADGKMFASTNLAKEPTALVFANQAKQLAVAIDNSIQLWTLPTEAATNWVAGKVLNGHTKPVIGLESVGIEGLQLVSASTDGSARLWKVESGEQVRSVDQGAPITAIALTPDGKRLATGGENKTVRLWNVADGKMLRELKGEYRAAYHARESQQAVNYSKNILAWRKSGVETTQKERQAQVERVRKASDAAAAAEKALGDKEKQIAASKAEQVTADKALADARAELLNLRERSTNAESALVKSKAAIRDELRKVIEARLATNSALIRAEFQGILTNALQKLAALGTTNAVSTNAVVAAAPTNSPAASDTAFVDKFVEDIAARAVEAATAKVTLANLQPEAEKKEKAAGEKVQAVAKAITDGEAALKPLQIAKASADNEMMFAINGAQKALDAFTDAQNALQLAEADLKHENSIAEAAETSVTNALQVARSLAFSADGNLLAAAHENRIALWSSEKGLPLETILTPNATVLGFIGTNSLLTQAASRLQAWSTLPGWKLERTIGSATGDSPLVDRVNAVRFSPDGQFLATGGGEPSRSGELKLWRVRDGQLAQDLKGLHSDVVLALAFTPDSRYLATGSADHFAKVIEVASGKVLRSLEGHTHHVLSVSWKRDGHTLMTGGGDNLVKVWDAFTGEKRKNIEGFNKEVTSVNFIGDTDQALVACGDNSLRIVKDNGEKVRGYEGSPDFLQAALASPETNLVFAGGEDGTLRLWSLDSAKLVATYSR